MNLQSWIEQNNLDTEVTLNNYLTLHSSNYYILPEKEKVITDEFTLNISDDEFEEAEENQCQYVIFKFGDKYYYTALDTDNEVQFNIFRYIGQSTDYILNYPFLGVHGKYELMNGTREYEDWVTKAQFLGILQLGICEKNTLAGAINFQQVCKDNNIKPILGEQITVSNEGSSKFDVKVYVVNNRGWQNLLRINKILNVDNVNNKFIYIWDLINYAGGLILVLQNGNVVNDLGLSLINKFKQNFHSVLFQFDSVEYQSDQKDKEYLDSLQLYLKKWKGIIPPILINDAYYLEKEDSHIKIILNELDQGVSQYKSDDQYFKSLADNFDKLNKLFKEDAKLHELMEEMIENLEWLVGECNFEINLSEKHLPEFYHSEYNDVNQLFFDILDKGYQEKIVGKVDDEDIYIERLAKEIELIQSAGVVNYFLSVWDMINWCADNDILTGPGRGSGAGALVSYLMGITQVDPIQFNLIFERFLNESRVKKELPDIDIDYESKRRKEVKNYLIEAYGDNYVTAIGTYQTMQLRAAIKELGRNNGLEEKDLNYITKLIDFALGEDVTWGSIFKKALDKPKVKEFIQNNFQLINDIRLCLGMPKSQGVHAAGMIVVPKYDDKGNAKQVYDWMPVKDIDGNLVSEWEGSFVDKAGFLKHDVLGLTQLDILSFIKKQLKENKGVDINLEHDIKFGDKNVYALFQKGYTEDVFQFTSTGLKAYCQDLKPDSIEDLIAAVALYRPGPMENNMHYDYIKLKYKEKDPEYDYMLEDVTRETYGLYIYQEQIMKSVQILGNLDLDSSEKVRKAIGKKIYSEMEKWKKEFIKGAYNNGCEEYEAIKIWNKFEAFAKYSFNRCISGKEKFYKVGFNKDKSQYHPTIEEMYKIKNDSKYAKDIGKKELHFKYKHKGYGMCFSLGTDNKLRRNKIVDIYYEGVNPLYRVTLENGSCIEVTMNHKFPTNNGEKKLEDIDINNDKIFYNLGYVQDIHEYSFIKKEKSDFNIGNKWWESTDRGLNVEEGKVGFQKRKTEYTEFQRIKKKKQKEVKECELCGINFKENNIKREAHHVDFDHFNNVEDNIVLICPSCHKKEHYKVGRKKMGQKGLKTDLLSIKDIKYVGEESVYNVEVEGPNHNFVTNEGVVTSNSHSTSYAILGYWSAYLKYYYPLEFWTASFEFADDNEVSSRITELSKLDNGVEIVSPDINSSKDHFTNNIDEGKIYWSLNKIKMVGTVICERIVEERNKNGDFFSLNEFRQRISKKDCGKNVLFNLILAGAFDEVEEIEDIRSRNKLIKRWAELTGSEIPEEFTDNNRVAKKYFWVLKQKDLTGLGVINYKDIAEGSNIKGEFIESNDFFRESMQNKNDAVVGGVLNDIVERQSKKGKFAQLELATNDNIIYVTIWNDMYDKFKKEIKQAEGKIVMVSGTVKKDKFKQVNVLYSNELTNLQSFA